MKTMFRVFGYLKYNSKRKITYSNEYPDPGLPGESIKHDWNQLYGGSHKEIPEDIPKPLGKDVCLTTFFDANHAFDLGNHRSVTGVLLFVNKLLCNGIAKGRIPLRAQPMDQS